MAILPSTLPIRPSPKELSSTDHTCQQQATHMSAAGNTFHHIIPSSVVSTCALSATSSSAAATLISADDECTLTLKTAISTKPLLRETLGKLGLPHGYFKVRFSGTRHSTCTPHIHTRHVPALQRSLQNRPLVVSQSAQHCTMVSSSSRKLRVPLRSTSILSDDHNTALVIMDLMTGCQWNLGTVMVLPSLGCGR